MIAFLHFFTGKALAAEIITESHGFALYGDLKYPQDFSHFDHVNPNAAKGGNLRLMGFGSFDSLNPYILKGTSPFNSPGMFMYGFTELNETLLAGTGSYSPSGDEPQSAYALLAAKIRYPQNYAWVEFDIQPEAHFHDGHPVDAEDVVFSYTTLTEIGHPRFKQSLRAVTKVKAIDADTVRVEFDQADQAANILRFGEMPILPAHFWVDKDFERSSQTIPLLSGPYRVGDVKVGQSIKLERVKDAWFTKLPKGELNIYKGRYNFDTVVIDFYRDQSVAFEGFKSDSFDLFFDYTAKNWAKAYDFPALNEGKVIKAEIKHDIPSTTQAFFFNNRRKIFSDPKVREALSLMFDFEWTNKALFNGAYKRNQSYYPNSAFKATGLPSEEELELLLPHKKNLPVSLFESAFSLPKTKGNGNIRTVQRRALNLLKQAGWILKDGELRHANSGKVFSFEILIRQAGIQRVILPFVKNLQKIGITAEPRLIDTAQYKVRLDQFDYDMTTVSLSQGQAPSYEQRDYFHSDTVNIEGSQNYAGINDPVVDDLLGHVLRARTRAELIVAMNALDRVLLWRHYSIPNWHLNYHRLAYWDRFARPSTQPPYKLGVENWWRKTSND
ncbi:ABC transporter substrate-binding protein [Oleiphilus sp. HI0072]|nr:ABC transporter substrate-binding protein [Oleiphilus sp. HI0043]KZY82392.1 ABC transporter substrate-binding protein [Oleiphilus sp. HI0069]KZY97274.1 ABC transporter substrate-binding protein [Oleiphilus sp. HI0072]KZZ34652.1 ABC transporter substrate-binding protein [Oleiphilus sp. HI0117]KZZ72433.1 ABC transporter substrate-binding protein [Oleiphilus sp. HI0128]